jgi:hypothetical protein
VKRGRVETVSRSFQKNAWTIAPLENERPATIATRARAPFSYAAQNVPDLQRLRSLARNWLAGVRSDLIETPSLRGDDASGFQSIGSGIRKRDWFG